MTSLRGKRIVITRPQGREKDFAEALQTRGAHPIPFPTILIHPLEDTSSLDRALNCLAGYDWMVLTSANAVEAVGARLSTLELTCLPHSLQVAAVGPKTAAALKVYGITPDLIPEEYVAEAILPAMGDLFDRWVLLPQADIAKDTLPVEISAAGGIPHIVTAYHTLPAHPNPYGLQALSQGVDVITFTSGSTARNFVALTQAGGIDPFNLRGTPLLACIGSKTAQAARQAGLEVDIVAQKHTLEGLVDVIQEYFMAMEKSEDGRLEDWKDGNLK